LFYIDFPKFAAKVQKKNEIRKYRQKSKQKHEKRSQPVSDKSLLMVIGYGLLVIDVRF